MRKAISPVVAAVILVAATILIGTVAVVWLSGFNAEQLSRVDAASCATGARYIISDVQVNSTGGIRLRLTNTGQPSLSNFTLEAELSNGSIFRLPARSPAATENLTTSQTDFVIAAQGSSLDNLVRSVKVLNAVCPQSYATTTTVTYKSPFG